MKKKKKIVIEAGNDLIERIVCVMKAENTVTDKLLLSMRMSSKCGFGPEPTVQSWKKEVCFQEITLDSHMLHHHS